MDFFENRYFWLSRTLMIWIGEWPYDTSAMKTLRRVLISIIFLSVINFVVTTLLTQKHNLDLLIEVCTPLLICLICFTKYCAGWINGDMIKKLLENIKADWNALQAESEIKIIKEYAENFRLFAMFYLSCIYVGISIFMLLTLLPIILDVMIPLNEPRVMQHPFEFEYFIDKEKYFYEILVYQFVVAYVIHTVAIATDLTTMVLILHACALNNILGYRLEHLFDDTVEPIEKAANNNVVELSTRIILCVKYHRKILKYVEVLHHCYLHSYLMQFLFVVLTLTGLLVRLFERLAPLKNINEAIGCGVHAVGLIFIIFLSIYPAQMLMNTSTEIFYQAYYARWYSAPVKVQKLMLFLMQRTIEPCRLTAANLVTASVETCATIVQTSLSYFTMVYSIRRPTDDDQR